MSTSFVYAIIAGLFSFGSICVLHYFNFNHLILHKAIEIGILMGAIFLLMNQMNENGKVNPSNGFFAALLLGAVYAISLSVLYISNLLIFDIDLTSELFKNVSTNQFSLFIITGIELLAYALVIALLSLQYFKKPASEYQ